MQTLLFLFLIAPAQLFAQADCLSNQLQNKIVLTCPQISVEQETVASNIESMEVHLNNNFNMKLTILKTPTGLTQSFSYSLGERILPQLNNNDALTIEQVAQEMSLRNLEDQFYLIQYFINLPVHESLESLTQPSGEVPWPTDKDDDDKDQIGTNKPPINANQSNKPQYTSLCKSIGKKQKASFVLIDTRYTTTVKMGDVKNKCYGRCGYGCGSQSSRTAYTQECLNHDFCHRHLGVNLGLCSPYFYKAVPSFLFAPNCNKV